jgi:hypothetical protein
MLKEELLKDIDLEELKKYMLYGVNMQENIVKEDLKEEPKPFVKEDLKEEINNPIKIPRSQLQINYTKKE